jgi:hypothetical protein
MMKFTFLLIFVFFFEQGRQSWGWRSFLNKFQPRNSFLLNSINADELHPTENIVSESNVLLSVVTDEYDTNLVTIRDDDLIQKRNLDEILYERARRFYDPNAIDQTKEKCILVSIQRTSGISRHNASLEFSFDESLQELSELVGTAGLTVCGCIIQRLPSPNMKTYVGSGKIIDIIAEINRTNAHTIVIDGDLTSKQQRGMEDAFASYNLPPPTIKVLDRTAVILEIFAQHASSKEGQLQVELAMLQYRMTRGPRARGNQDDDNGCGFRGPGESKIETDKRIMKDKIIQIKKELEIVGMKRKQHRQGR